MTRWTPFPIRQAGQPWAGMNSEGGKTDNGQGQLNENSRNCTINKADELSKRSGFVRGLAERFGTVVCGLHTYVDNCGNEYLLVASDEGIAIRQPFNVPSLAEDDAYPLDDFQDEDGLSTANWRNTDLYIATGGALLRASGNSSSPFDATSFLRWFKAAGALAYQVTIEYVFDVNVTGQQVCSICIKGNGDLQSGRRLQVDLIFDSDNGTYRVQIYKTNAANELVDIGNLAVVGSLTNPTGFLTLEYVRSFSGPSATYYPKVTIVPNGGGAQTQNGFELDSLEDMELGQISAIGCSQGVSILQVTGEPT
jgi:hypothetical protein